MITDREAEVYDRQIRLWGVEAQRRMKNSTVLISGLTALNSEVTKNIVLSGINVALQDDGAVSAADLGANFFLSQADIGKQRALAALPAIRDLNPLVTVCTVDGSISTMSDDSLAAYSVVCLASGTSDELAAVDARCRRLGLDHLLIGFSHACGDVMAMGLRRTTVAADGTETIVTASSEFVSFAQSISADWGSIRRFPVLLGAMLSSCASASVPDAAAFCDARGLKDVPAELLTAVRSTWGKELSPVAAILGGIVGQEVVKAISRKDEPINNFFLFDGDTCFGTVSTIV